MYSGLYGLLAGVDDMKRAVEVGIKALRLCMASPYTTGIFTKGLVERVAKGCLKYNAEGIAEVLTALGIPFFLSKKTCYIGMGESV